MTMNMFFEHQRAAFRRLKEAGVITKRDYDAEIILIDEAEHTHEVTLEAMRGASRDADELRRMISETRAMFGRVVA